MRRNANGDKRILQGQNLQTFTETYLDQFSTDWKFFGVCRAKPCKTVQNHCQTRLLRSSYIVFLRFTYFKSGRPPASHFCMMVTWSERIRPTWVLPQPTSEAIVRQDWPLSSRLSTSIRCFKPCKYLYTLDRSVLACVSNHCY